MYKTAEIQNLSELLERGEISPDQCLSSLFTIQMERIALKERCEAMKILEYNKRSAIRMAEFKRDPVGYDANFELKQAWRDSKTGTDKFQTLVRFTKAYELGLVDEQRLIDYKDGESFEETCKNLKDLLK